MGVIFEVFQSSGISELSKDLLNILNTGKEISLAVFTKKVDDILSMPGVLLILSFSNLS